MRVFGQTRTGQNVLVKLKARPHRQASRSRESRANSRYKDEPYNRFVETPQHRFAFFVAQARARHSKQFRFSMLVSLLIALLLWQTQWISLRPGLFTLLAGQLAAGLYYLRRSTQLNTVAAVSGPEMLAWFKDEMRVVTFATLSESLMRILGFVILAYGFWNATRILWITLLLGVAYPVISYFGVAKRNASQVLKLLQQQQTEVQQS